MRTRLAWMVEAFVALGLAAATTSDENALHCPANRQEKSVKMTDIGGTYIFNVLLSVYDVYVSLHHAHLSMY